MLRERHAPISIPLLDDQIRLWKINVGQTPHGEIVTYIPTIAKKFESLKLWWLQVQALVLLNGNFKQSDDRIDV